MVPDYCSARYHVYVLCTVYILLSKQFVTSHGPVCICVCLCVCSCKRKGCKSRGSLYEDIFLGVNS